jgi:hypothetical protein
MEIPKHYKDDPKYVDYLQDVINDLTLVVEMYMSDYPFDEDHKCKQQRLVDYASQLIGKPRTIEEAAQMVGITRKKQDAEKDDTDVGRINPVK